MVSILKWRAPTSAASCSFLVAVCCVMPVPVLGQDAGTNMSALPTQTEDAIKCFDLCTQSFRLKLDDASKALLNKCEAELGCLTRLQYDPEHGHTASMPRYQDRSLDSIYKISSIHPEPSMDKYINLYLLREAAAALILAFAVSLVCSIRWSRPNGAVRPTARGSDLMAYAGICVPLTAIAFATGFLTGFSRQPAVTATIPAILTLLGGIFAYVTAARPSANGPIAVGVVLFSMVLIFSTNYYSSVREDERVKRLLILSEQERVVRFRRENMDLPEEFPDWILFGESNQ